ncbi:MAG: DUF6529 family protein [Actinomycetota bacterium]
MDLVGFFNWVTGNNLLFWKVVAATIVFFGAGTQVFLAARLWKASTIPAMSEEAASTAHRWIGRVTLTLAMVVAVACVAGPAGPISPARALFHSIFGVTVLLVIATKFTILRILRKGYNLLPFVGTTLFLCLGALWATSVADYISR